MLIEGEGVVAPAPVVERIGVSDFTYAVAASESRNQFRRYSDRADQWGRGFVENPILVGMLGEIALCSFLNRRVGCRLSIDTELRARGDEGVDLSTDGIGLEVKTRNSLSRSNLYRRFDRRGGLRALRADVYVFCMRASEREIHLLGWLHSDRVASDATFKKSPVGDWFNLELKDRQLEPMSRLVAEILYRRSL